MEAATNLESLPPSLRLQHALERLVVTEPMRALDVIGAHSDAFVALPDSGRLGQLLGTSLCQAKLYREAADLVRLLSRINLSPDIGLCTRLARLLRQMREEAAAKEILSIALSRDSGCLLALKGMHELSVASGRLEEAHQWLDRLAVADTSYATMSFVYKERQKLPQLQSREIRIACLSSYVLDWLVPYLDLECRKAGLTALIYVAPFNQYTQEILNPTSELYRFRPDIVFLALGIEDVYPQINVAPRQDELAQAQGVIIEQVLGLVREIQARSGAVTVFHDFVLLPNRGGKGILDNKGPDGIANWLARINQSLADEFNAQERTFLLPLGSVIATVGKERGTSAKLWYMASMRLTEPALAELAAYSMRYIKPLKGLTRKCIVLDLDGTLWGGIIGEVGAEGVTLGPTAPGIAYVDFQRALLSLTRRGILLAICSKNNPEDALPVIRTHPHMMLREEHFAAIRINWWNKADNIREIAQELNIGLDALVFIDDNPNERELVRQLLPEVLTVDLPPDPSLYRRTLEELTDFDMLALTKEDEMRVAQYQANARRQSVKNTAGSLDEYLRSLDVRVAIDLAPRNTLNRLVQLFNKTNQFNLTTKRYQVEDVSRFMGTKDYRVYSLRVADRFGDHGLVGTAVIHREQDVWYIDSLLMSCRVMGLGIETAFLARILADAARDRVVQLVGWYIPTKKNLPVKEFYAQHGFSLLRDTDDRQEWTLDVAASSLVTPSWITTTNTIEVIQ